MSNQSKYTEETVHVVCTQQKSNKQNVLPTKSHKYTLYAHTHTHTHMLMHACTHWLNDIRVIVGSRARVVV